ncbi:MAG TPA: hypothetical protein VN757_10335 [Steroidobacteraceae bacterium]|nr:hypothetical protein [Steroidobacteraceae bacterium]
MIKDKAGVWIDHRKAFIVVVNPTGEHTALIVSKVEKHLERSGDSPLKGSFESAQVPADDSRQRRLTREFNIYYDAVIAALRNADSLVIFGPGKAKSELNKRLVKHKLGGRVTAVETVDKMTDRQIVAKVREYFAASASSQGSKYTRPKAGIQAKSPRRAPR